MVPTHIQISTLIHRLIDRSVCHGRYRRSVRFHLRRITVDHRSSIIDRDNFVIDSTDDTCAELSVSGTIQMFASKPIMLQCVAVCCSTLQFVAVCCSVPKNRNDVSDSQTSARPVCFRPIPCFKQFLFFMRLDLYIWS